MARPKKIRTVTSAEMLEFINTATLEILELVSELIEKKIGELKAGQCDVFDGAGRTK